MSHALLTPKVMGSITYLSCVHPIVEQILPHAEVLHPRILHCIFLSVSLWCGVVWCGVVWCGGGVVVVWCGGGVV